MAGHNTSIRGQRSQSKVLTTLELNVLAGHPSSTLSYPIIKRRIAWLIGKWVSSSCATPNNSRVWEILAYLLQDRGPGSDPVVRLTAAVAIKECADVGFPGIVLDIEL